MASSDSITKAAWGKAAKGFAAYINIAGQTIGKAAARGLAEEGAEFLANEDWDWPRGKRYDAIHPSGRAVRGAMPYASGFRGGDSQHPWYSGNLHDSMAVGVIQGTRILAARYMTPGADRTQTYKGQTVDGVTAGEDALRRAAHTFAPGQSGDTLRATLVVGVPYADEVNESPNHAGYVEYLSKQFYETLLPRMQQLRKIKLKLK